MTIQTLTYEAERASDVEALFDTAFASLLNHRILDFELIQANDERQEVIKKSILFVTVEDIGATITTPYKLRIFQASDHATVEAAYQSFIADNPTYFVSAPEYTYGANMAAPKRHSIACIYSTDEDDAVANWFFGQKGYKSLEYTAASDPTTGTWDNGDRRYESDAAASGQVGSVCTTAGTFGSLSGVTADTTNGSATVTDVSSLSDLRVGMYINIAGVTGPLKILAIDSDANELTVDQNADATVDDASVSYQTPVFKTFGAISA